MYDYITGPAKILFESEQNDMAIFEAIILTDMDLVEKSKTLQESELSVLQEESFKGFFTRIADYIEKLINKINEVINSFIKKLEMFTTKDNEQFVAKFSREIKGKDLSEFKYKIRPRTKLVVDNADIIKIYESNALNSFANLDNDDKDGIKRVLDKHLEGDEFLLQLLRSTVNLNQDLIKDPKSYKETVFNAAFEKEYKERTGLDNHTRDVDTDFDYLTAIMVLANNTRFKALKKSQKDAIDNLHALSKEFRVKDNNAAKDAQYKANAQYELMRVAERAYVDSFSVFMEIVKFEVKQCRSILEQALLYKSGPRKDEEEESKQESFSLQEYYGDVLMDEDF